MTWSKFIIAAWGLVLAHSTLLSHLPAGWWFDAGALRVENASVGDCPRLGFDREIIRPFRADWTVTLMRRGITGWSTYRTYHGGNDYRPGNSLPDDPDLCWWTWTQSLPLPPGEYRAHTLWEIYPLSGGKREVRRTSNAFTITPRE